MPKRATAPETWAPRGDTGGHSASGRTRSRLRGLEQPAEDGAGQPLHRRSSRHERHLGGASRPANRRFAAGAQRDAYECLSHILRRVQVGPWVETFSGNVGAVGEAGRVDDRREDAAEWMSGSSDRLARNSAGNSTRLKFAGEIPGPSSRRVPQTLAMVSDRHGNEPLIKSQRNFKQPNWAIPPRSFVGVGGGPCWAALRTHPTFIPASQLPQSLPCAGRCAGPHWCR